MPDLTGLQSYVLKTVMLHENQKRGLDWSQDAMADRVGVYTVRYSILSNKCSYAN